MVDFANKSDGEYLQKVDKRDSLKVKLECEKCHMVLPRLEHKDTKQILFRQFRDMFNETLMINYSNRKVQYT